MKEKKTIIAGIIFIAIVIISVIGLTVAYFTASVGGNEEASSTIIETADLRLIFSDTELLTMEEALPGRSETKQFTVENKGNVEIEYTIGIKDLVNDFVNNELVYSLTSDNGGATATRVPLPTSEEDYILQTATIAPGTVQTYTITILFLETGSDQNANQGAIFSGTLQINTGDRLSNSVITLAERMKVDNNIMSDANINFNYSSNGITGCTWTSTGGWSCAEPDPYYITEDGLYFTSNAEDTEGGVTVYYYRGNVENNYVLFGDYCWRIVRTNEDGSIRLRYGGEPVEGSCPTTGTPVNVATGVTYNTDGTEARYVGYTYDDGTGTQVDSNIKTQVDAWYEANIWKNGQNTKVTDLIADAVYCNDRTEIVDSSQVRYGAHERVFVNHNPSYVCAQTVDKYTTSIDTGNGLLKYPVGLLTTDEIAYAGGKFGATNRDYYLHTGESYWGMSPVYFNVPTSEALVVYVHSDGRLTNYLVTLVTLVNAVVPVISVKGEAKVSSGTGEYNSPYVILTE